MRLGLSLGSIGSGGPAEPVRLAREAEHLGYSVIWASEAYGSDAATLLSWVAAHTSSIDVGSAVLQMPARTPVMTAMTAATLDLLTGGRFRLGLGVSGPQVSEGWHGVRFDAPLARSREYVEVVRIALARRIVTYDGDHFTLPLPDGPGRALKLTLPPTDTAVPIYLAAVGPKNLELTGEVADGWLAFFFAPEHAALSLEPLGAGTRRAGRSLLDVDVNATVPVVVGDDLEAGANQLRGHTALYVGGMGSRTHNFYNALVRRMGFGDAARRVQDLYLDGHPREAMAAVPRELIDQTALIGPCERIAERLHAYAEAGVTTLSVQPFGHTSDARLAAVRGVSEALTSSGLVD